MPRTLPWTTARKSHADNFTGLPSPKPSKRRRTQPLSDSDSDAPAAPPRRQDEFNKHYPGVTGVRSRARSPSTSPPPTPPELEFMAAGGSDDEWTMVEDEFMSTAQQFTKHLHHAAYQERKAAAARRGVAAANVPARDDSLAKAHAIEKLASKYGQPVERAGSEEAEGGDDLIIGDRRLARLMFGNGTGGKSKTRLDGLVSNDACRGSAQDTKAAKKPIAQSVVLTNEATEVDMDDPSADDDLDDIPARPSPRIPGGSRPSGTPRAGHSISLPPDSTPAQYRLGPSILGQSRPTHMNAPSTQPQHNMLRETQLQQELDADGLPKRRQAPTLAELRRIRAAGKAKAMPGTQAAPQSPGNTTASLQATTSSASPKIVDSAPGRDLGRISVVKEEQLDQQDVVPLFLA